MTWKLTHPSWSLVFWFACGFSFHHAYIFLWKIYQSFILYHCRVIKTFSFIFIQQFFSFIFYRPYSYIYCEIQFQLNFFQMAIILIHLLKVCLWTLIWNSIFIIYETILCIWIHFWNFYSVPLVVCLFMCQYYTVLIFETIKYILVPGGPRPSTSCFSEFFLIYIAFGLLNFRIIWSSFWCFY